MEWTKEEKLAYLRQYRKDHPNYVKEWYHRNAEHILKRRKRRYREDEEFREKQKAASKKQHERKKQEQDGSK